MKTNTFQEYIRHVKEIFYEPTITMWTSVLALSLLCLCLACGSMENVSSTCTCEPRKWQIVSKLMISQVISGAKVSYNETSNGLNINVQVVNYGCGKGPGSGTVFYVLGDWTHIRYTQEFYGSATCWKIFGTTAAPKYRRHFSFGANIKVPFNNVKDFDGSVGDGIFNQYRMTDLRTHHFNGQVYRCDSINENRYNFWFSLNGRGMRRATVLLRRSGAGPAGISTETSCGTPHYVIKDIWVLI